MRRFDRLIETYLSARESEEKDELDWGSWAGEGQPEGEAYFVDTDVYLRKAVAIRLLQLAADQPDEEIRQHEFPAGREGITSLLDTGDHSLRRTFTEVDAGKWDALVPKAARAKIPALIASFDKTLATKAAKERAKIVAATLSPAKISEFIAHVKKGFENQAAFNALAAKYGFLKSATKDLTAKGSAKSFGFTQVAPKEAFIDDYPAFWDFGEDYGGGMARGEDRYAFQALTSALDAAGDPVTKAEDIAPALVEAYSKLKKAGVSASTIISSLDLEDTANLRQTERFTPTWAMKKEVSFPHGFIGLFNVAADAKEAIEIPVFRLMLERKKRSEEHGLCLVEIGKLGEMVRLFPGESEEDRAKVDDYLYCSIIDLNIDDGERKQILDSNTKWLSAHEAEGKENYLRGRVLMKIYQRTDFRFNKSAGLKVLVSKALEQQT